MDRGSDDVRRPLSGELDDVLAEVRLDRFDARRRDGPPAGRPDRGRGDATIAGTRIDPVPNFGRAGLAQAQADPAQPGRSGGILSQELSPAAAIPASCVPPSVSPLAKLPMALAPLTAVLIAPAAEPRNFALRAPSTAFS